MPRSMTGYGAAAGRGGGARVEVEARSVNARSLKVAFRGPGALAAHETDLEALVRKVVARGSVSLGVRLERTDPGHAVRVRPEVVEGAARALAPLRKRGLIQGAFSADAVAGLPGAIESGADEALAPAEWRAVREAARKALERLDGMRRREAVHLVRGLRQALARMRRALQSIGKRAPVVVEEQRAKLRQRVDALLRGSGATLDEATLAREVALLADRSDVTEEVTRLGAHLAEFGGYLERDGEIGRTLDFLAQEMLREANTIGSKSGDVAIARAVIELKSDIDRLKEQVANLE